MYQQQAPPAHLAPWVECVWTITGSAEGAAETILPDGRMEVIVHHGFRPNHQAARFVTGQITSPVRLEATGPMRTMGMRLRPAAAAAFLGIPAFELRDKFTEMACQSTAVLPDPAITRAVQRIEQTRGTVRMDALTREINCSPRHLDRLFLHAVGLPPKTFARIIRFQAVIAAYRDGNFRQWADLAHAGGFYDQSHLANEFRRFSGAAPAAFFRHPSALALLMANFSKTPSRRRGYPQDECVL